LSGGKIFALLFVVFAFLAGTIGLGVLGFYNSEVTLRTSYEAKTDANKADFDNVWKTISQVAQVPDKYKQDFQSVYESYMTARTAGNDGSGAMLNFLTEAVPQYDAKELYVKVQTVVEAKRESWTARQKELRDIKREHDQLLRTFPGVFYNVFLGRDELPVVLVTSTRTEESFSTGTDDNVQLY
jgi:hypothetical protein